MKDVTNQRTSRSRSVAYDEGLRSYMSNIYKYMAMALLLTGCVSYIVAEVAVLRQLFIFSPLSIVFVLAPLIFVIYFSSKIWSMSPESARNHLFIYSALIGVSLSSIFLAYTGESIVRTLLVSSSMFAGMSIYGYSTKKDLTGVGSFMMMGLIGIIIASLVNIFLRSTGMQFAISILGVIIFAGLTAYDTQKLKQTYDYVGINSDVKDKVAIIGALNLYMDFINLFILMLNFSGNRKN